MLPRLKKPKKVQNATGNTGFLNIEGLFKKVGKYDRNKFLLSLQL